MSDDGSICGYVKDDGEKCQRVAGWGTPSEFGHCRDHAEEYRVPRKMGEETIQQICGAAQRGAFKKHCARVAGITPQTLHNWLSDGKEHVEDGLETPLSKFYLRFQRARASGAAEKLNEASPEFILERSYGYTKTEAVELSGPGGGPVQTAEVDEDEKEILLKAFEEEPET